METKHILLAGLVLADIPAYVLLFKLLFKGALPSRREGRAPQGGSADQRGGREKLPRLGEILASENFKDRGGEMKLLLLATASALLVLVEYLVLLSLFPGLAGAR